MRRFSHDDAYSNERMAWDTPLVVLCVEKFMRVCICGQARRGADEIICHRPGDLDLT
jgi:hypothetical protein